MGAKQSSRRKFLRNSAALAGLAATPAGLAVAPRTASGQTRGAGAVPDMNAMLAARNTWAAANDAIPSPAANSPQAAMLASAATMSVLRRPKRSEIHPDGTSSTKTAP